jgi:CheY-like chemotaxis protein
MAMSVAHQENEVEERPKVLVVDDEPFNLEIMQEILEEDYEVSYAKSGGECMDMVDEIMPDVVLLDVNMPGMSGYEVCQKIKENPKTTDIPVTFVSALDTLAERLAGYEVGGDDYICKPFESSELLSKVTIAVKYKKEKESLRIDAERAMEKAMTLTRGSDDSGVMVNFLRSSLSCASSEELANLTLQTIGTMNLRSSVQIRNGEDVVHKSSDGSINQLERTVVKKMSKEDRVVDLGVRSVFNYDHVSVLVKNMPTDDKSKRDSIKAKISLVTEAIEIRLLGLMQAPTSNSALPSAALSSNVLSSSDVTDYAELSQKLSDLVVKIDQTLGTVNPQYIKILTDLSFKLESEFSNLSLTEEQEQAVMRLVEDAIGEAHALQSAGENVSQQVSVLAKNISGLLKAS